MDKLTNWNRIALDLIVSWSNWFRESRPLQPNQTNPQGATPDDAKGDIVDLHEASASPPAAARPESLKSSSPTCVDNQHPSDEQEIERRRTTVRKYFVDFWDGIEDRPKTFAERLNAAEQYINDRLADRGEAWRLDATSRKQLGLPAPPPGAAGTRSTSDD
jgi:hypothetical protein